MDTERSEVQPNLAIEKLSVDWGRLGLVIQPFSIEADPRFMYISTETRRALSKVSYMVEAAQGVSVVVGEIGTGKTTLASWFHSRYQLRSDFVVARIDEPPKRSGLLLLRRIAAEFGLPTRRATEHQLNELRGLMTEQGSKGVLPLIVIDEAHELGSEQYRNLRKLLNFRDESGGKAFQVVLLGRPELDINLRKAPDFNDRVVTRSSLDPLTPDDTKALIEYRLLAAGRDGRQPPLFLDDAYLPIWQDTRGYPRGICTLSHHLCLELLISGGLQIDEKFVKRFLEDNADYRHAH